MCKTMNCSLFVFPMRVITLSLKEIQTKNVRLSAEAPLGAYPMLTAGASTLRFKPQSTIHINSR